MTATCGGMDVSRETIDRLRCFADLVGKWNPKINLVAKSTLADLWGRHIEDSAQIAQLARPDDQVWGDLGTGGGFPGLVVAIILAEKQPQTRVLLIESDGRKSAFLRTATATLGLGCEVICDRIERIPPLAANTLSARALAPLPRLLELSVPHLAPGGQCIFPKGRGGAEEIAAARQTWRFQCRQFASMTSPEAAILRLRDIELV